MKELICKVEGIRADNIAIRDALVEVGEGDMAFLTFRGDEDQVNKLLAALKEWDDIAKKACEVPQEGSGYAVPA
jgi:hypothetical protein